MKETHRYDRVSVFVDNCTPLFAIGTSAFMLRIPHVACFRSRDAISHTSTSHRNRMVEAQWMRSTHARPLTYRLLHCMCEGMVRFVGVSAYEGCDALRTANAMRCARASAVGFAYARVVQRNVDGAQVRRWCSASASVVWSSSLLLLCSIEQDRLIDRFSSKTTFLASQTSNHGHHIIYS